MQYYIDANGMLIEKSGVDYRLKIGRLSKSEFDTYRIATDEEVESILNPTQSTEELFEQEIAALNIKHYKDVLEATNQYNIAVARDGSTEGEKVIAARANLADIDAQFELDQLAIINKYYGE